MPPPKLSLMFFLAIVGSFIIFDLLWWRWAHQALGPTRRRRLWRALLAAFVLTMLGGFVLIFVSRMFSFDLALPTFAIAAIYIWHLLILQITIVLIALASIPSIIARVIAALRRLASTNLSQSNTDSAAATPDGASRRQLLRAAAVAVPPLCLTGAITRSQVQLDDFRIRKLNIPISDLPASLDGLTIAHVSDLHAGKFTRPRHLRQIVSATNDLSADLVLITGDLIDFQINALDDVIPAVLSMNARHGVYACEGNHDLFENRRGFELGVKSAGINLLLNETARLRIRGEMVQLMGLAWGYPGTRRDALDVNLPRLLPQRDPDAFPILLAHHPHAFDTARAAGIPLTLAGHTHGGQLMLSDSLGAGPMMYNYWSGLYTRGASSLVVSNGVGNWFPLRTHAPAEIIHLTLRRV